MTGFLSLIYALCFLSGAAALLYQVVWLRSLSLLFGASYLAVAVVLATFMSGLAIGGCVVGRRADTTRRPLRLFGLLQFGMAASALLFAGVTQSYPAVYHALAQGRGETTVSITIVRVVLSAIALLVPGALIGGTLPVLSRFLSRQPDDLRGHLPGLYGFNTFGAMTGALASGFWLLPLSLMTTVGVAVAMNVVVGGVSVLLQRKVDDAPAAGAPDADACVSLEDGADVLPLRLALWGIGVGGFCAAGYQTLWTRVLAMTAGASAYADTLILVAFLGSVALGSAGYGLLARAFRVRDRGANRLVAWFGITQVVIGASALVATIFLADVAPNVVRLQRAFNGDGAATFPARMWASLTLACLYMAIPASFIGAAFPIAGEAISRYRKAVGRGVGEAFAANTIGALLGAVVASLLMVRLFGIERSLQLLVVVNVTSGLVVWTGLRGRRWVPAVVAGAALGAIALLAVDGGAARVWDPRSFAVFRSNQPEVFRTPDTVRDAVENTDVLYYAEGVESIVSVIKVKGGEQALVANGRVAASSDLPAQQIGLTLGHLPMMLHRDPKQVLVVGLGSGMTAGAALVHPSTERLTVVESEPKVVEAARKFDGYNHHLLDDPKVHVVAGGARGFLSTTTQTFDVITVYPGHPWFRSAGNLYSSDYFGDAARHLAPGGVMAQWLPVYELAPADTASVVRTFQQRFPHTLLWLTHADAVMMGSSAPLTIDEAELERRLAFPAVSVDMAKIGMGSATDLLSYFVMGTEGMRRLAQSGVVITDTRPSLEFSAPLSVAKPSLMADNVSAIAAHRESLLPYLEPAPGPAGLEAQRSRWELQVAAARIADPALAFFLGGRADDPHFVRLLHRLNLEYGSYAPGRFLTFEYQSALALEPRLLQQSSFALLGEGGRTATLDLSAVLVPVSRTRASVMFVDNRARVVYGQSYVDDYATGTLADRLAVDVMNAVRTAYEHEAVAAREQRQAAPPAARTISRIRGVIVAKVQRVQAGS